MNAVRVDGENFALNANLLACVNLALDLSEVRDGEIEVFQGPSKIASFRQGKRTFPARRAPEIPTLNLQNLEAWAIERAMKEANGNISEAAELLGMGRTTLWRKLRETEEPRALAKAA